MIYKRESYGNTLCLQKLCSDFRERPLWRYIEQRSCSKDVPDVESLKTLYLESDLIGGLIWKDVLKRKF